MRALVFTFVLLVVTGAYLAVYLSAPPEGAGGEPHVNVKVKPPAAGQLEQSEAGGKAQGNFMDEALQLAKKRPAPAAEPEPALPSAVTSIPSLGGAAATGSAPGVESGGVTVTEQLIPAAGDDQ